MGALHAGHLSLVKKIFTQTDKVIVSIFINPKQFGVGEDLERYPKDEVGDCQKLADMGVDVVFIPDGANIYPENFATNIHVAGLGDRFCGAERLGHFDGVATIVTKLLNQTTPDVAIFGEKDFQQLTIIKQMVADLDLPVKIISGEIIREDNGLALSSRNAYLSDEQIKTALELSATLKKSIIKARAGDDLRTIEADCSQYLLDKGFSKIDYFSFIDSKTLTLATDVKTATRVLAAGHLGGTRLIDNFAV